MGIRRKEFIGIILGLILIWGIMFALNYQTPVYKDDFKFKSFFMTFEASPNINSFWDLIKYQPSRYLHVAGRTMVNIAEQSFAGLIGKSIFNFINPTIFLIFVVSLTNFLGNLSFLRVIFIFSLILLLFPGFNETCLWMSGSINYMWVCTGIIIFVLYILKYEHKGKLFPDLLFIPIFFIVGWSHESLSSPLAVSLIFSMLLFNRNEFNGLKRIVTFSFIIGSFFCLLAPGNFMRSNGLPLDFKARIGSGLFLFFKLRAFFVFVAVFLSFIIYHISQKNVFKWLKQFYLNNNVFINSLILSFPFLFVSGLLTNRISTGVEFYSILLILQLVKEFPKKLFYLTESCFIVGACVLLIGIFHYTYINFIGWKKIESQIASRKSEVIVFDDFPFPKYIKNYVLTPVLAIRQVKHDISWNPVIARVVDYKRINFFPKSIYEKIVNGTLNIDYEDQVKYPFYVFPLKDYYKFEEDSERFIVVNDKRGEEIKVPLSSCEILKINGRLYLILVKELIGSSIPKQLFANSY